MRLQPADTRCYYFIYCIRGHPKFMNFPRTPGGHLADIVFLQKSMKTFTSLIRKVDSISTSKEEGYGNILYLYIYTAFPTPHPTDSERFFFQEEPKAHFEKQRQTPAGMRQAKTWSHAGQGHVSSSWPLRPG